MCYKFWFMNGSEDRWVSIYAYSEAEAWSKADEWACENGYNDLIMVGL